MPRTYKKRKGSRNYANYTEESVNLANDKIKKKQLSCKKASEIHNIPIITLFNKRKGLHLKKAGGQPVFSEEEETKIAAYCIALSIYGFPITAYDLRIIVKSYLDGINRKVSRFANNMPGRDWAKSFIKRHKNLSVRTAKNISVARAKVGEEEVNKFFDFLEKELKDIPPSNIYNYDETNLSDNPGDEKVITKRGVKYPENIRNSSKACTSIMIAGNAEGEILPIYVCYKAVRMHVEWTQYGPPGARYNRTPSGWFDSDVFEDWYFSCALPALKKKTGVKALIGDNLSSHISIKVLQSCEENQIKFIALPPNSTHWLQPLDVAFFRPFKGKWKEILNEWKNTGCGARAINVPKDTFPSLIKKLMEVVGGESLVSGFRKTGIYPLNRSKALEKLPSNVLKDADIAEALENSFLKKLEQKRAEVTTHKTKRTQVHVPAGKSVTAEEVLKLREEQQSKAKAKKSSTGKRGRPKKKVNENCESDNEEALEEEAEQEWADENELSSNDDQVCENDNEDDIEEGIVTGNSLLFNGKKRKRNSGKCEKTGSLQEISPKKPRRQKKNVNENDRSVNEEAVEQELVGENFPDNIEERMDTRNNLELNEKKKETELRK